MTDLTPDDGGLVRISGDLTVDEVPDVHRQSLAWKDNGLPAVIDLAGVEHSDSSAVALLLEWAEWACRANRDIEFRNPIDSMRTIAGLSDLEPLLGWEDEK
ncbi:MAG: STAS domain-containing protein [Wenzhouxiangellaceae bacterium]